MFLYDLPQNRKNVPELIKDPVELIKDVRQLVERHCKDQPELAITGRPILHRDLNRGDNFVLSTRLQMDPDDGDANNLVQLDDSGGTGGTGGIDNDGDFVSPQTVSKSMGSGAHRPHKKNGTGPNLNGNGAASNNAPRRRRRRCKTCAPCNSSECGHCAFCLDMVSTYCVIAMYSNCV